MRDLFSTFLVSVPLVFAASLACAQSGETRTGDAALSGWKSDAPGVRRHIKPSDLPAPATGNHPETTKGSNAKVVAQPQGAPPKVPDGFAVQVFASGFKQPRTLRVAPNGDIFLSESGAGRVLVFRPGAGGTPAEPEVLIQAHSSALSVAFYDREAFPAEYRGDAFVALHGSHTRPERTGYKVIRVHMNEGNPTGAYEDFMTGFMIDNDTVWGRPAGVAVTRDGALLVSDDANGAIFRVTRQ